MVHRHLDRAAQLAAAQQGRRDERALIDAEDLDDTQALLAQAGVLVDWEG